MSKKGKGETLPDHTDNGGDGEEARKENSGNAADAWDGLQWGWGAWGQKEKEKERKKGDRTRMIWSG